MDKNQTNAIKRARKSAGITQEKAAEMSGYSVDAIQAWEAGTRRASVEVLDTLAVCYEAPWLAGMYLRELSQGSVAATFPEFQPGVPLPQAVVTLLDKMGRFAEGRSDRRLIAMSADGCIDDQERAEFDQIMEELHAICEAAMELKFSRQGGRGLETIHLQT